VHAEGDQVRLADFVAMLSQEQEAMAAVPDRLVDEVSLTGPAAKIRERIEAWKASPVTDMLMGCGQPEALRVLAESVL